MQVKLLLSFFLLPLFVKSSNENYSIGARYAGMGNASVSLSDIWSVHHNQAGIARLTRPGAGIYYEQRFLIKDLGIKGIVFAFPTLKFGSFGLELNSFGNSLYSENKLGLSYAMKLNDKLFAGVQMDYFQTKISENYGNKNNFIVELGFQAIISKGLTIGGHIYNPMRAKLNDFANERLTTILRFGIDYKFSKKLLVAIESEKDVKYPATFKAGIEYKLLENLHLRTGINTYPFSNFFGITYLFKTFRVDLASSYHNVLGYTPSISISYIVKNKQKSAQ